MTEDHTHHGSDGKLKAEIASCRQRLEGQPGTRRPMAFGNIVGQSEAMQKVYDHILDAAASDATVVLSGEPGTGKELVSQAIHDMSDRRAKRFVPVHCGAIPENLIESEFFGYKKGAFTGAMGDKPGYMDYADGGTLFLDEVGEVSTHMQVKLLRIIEGGGYTPVGDSQVKTSDVRIITATNRNLRELVEQGVMREDFFYRIHILPIQLPALRKRKEDLQLLIDHFMGLYVGKRDVLPLSSQVMEELYQYHWPGNVRELQNVIIRYCNQNKIDLGDTTAVNTGAATDKTGFSEPVKPGTIGLGAMVEKYERLLILNTLNQYQWHRQKTAVALNVDRKTLFNKMKRYGLSS